MASGDRWATDVEERRQGRTPPGHLTERECDVLRKRRSKDAGPTRDRPKASAADEIDAGAIVGAYEGAMRRIIGDKNFVALADHWNDARRILPDLRLLRERRQLAATPAGIVAHKLETYLRDPRSKPWPLRWLLDRTEQDDLPKLKRQPRAPPPDLTSLPARSTRKEAERMSPEDVDALNELKKKLAGG